MDIIRQHGLQGNQYINKLALLLAGIWKHQDADKAYNLLLWSPLRTEENQKSNNEISQAAIRRWFIGVSAGILRINKISRSLFDQKWPKAATTPLGAASDGLYCSFPYDRTAPEYQHEKFRDLMQLNRRNNNLIMIQSTKLLTGTLRKLFTGIKAH